MLMKLTSRSILSPGRPGSARDQLPTTLSTSLSRRLKTSRSIKGGASPAMFPTAGKKRGSGFDNPEPSSPKVTCIGQVRVKSKKKHTKNLRSLSRRKTNGEGSFRKFEHLECLQAQRNNSNNNNNNNQKWVHIPLTICEALRTFGSEVSCLFPCRSSCSSTTMEKEEKIDDNRQGSTCGAALARWIVALQDGDNNGVGAEREVEMVDGNGDDDGNVRRRHVFQDLEIVNDSVIMGSRDEEGRMSICVPPKNALLLMRCRSDPMKMEALANRFWEPMMDQNEEEEFGHEEDEKVMALVEINDQEDDLQYHEVNQEIVEMDLKQSPHALPLTGLGIVVVDTKQSVQEDNVEKNSVQEEKVEMEVKQSVQEEDDDKKESIETNEEKEEESFFLEILFEEIEDLEQEFEEKEEEDFDMEDALEELFREEDVQETKTWESNIEKVRLFEDMVTEFKDNCDNETHEEIVMELDKVENEILEKENEDTSKALPECLLLMMYEPKLSMEVSKETWVCSRDFIRRNSSRKKPPPPPQPLAKSIEGQDESKVNGSSTTSDHVTTHEHNNHVLRMGTVQYESGLHQPARSSCSFPAPLSMATLLEQKLVNTTGYEPLVLTRCKSEPMRTAAAKLKPDTCYWKNKLEPRRRASFGIGMAGFGF